MLKVVDLFVFYLKFIVNCLTFFLLYVYFVFNILMTDMYIAFRRDMQM